MLTEKGIQIQIHSKHKIPNNFLNNFLFPKKAVWVGRLHSRVLTQCKISNPDKDSICVLYGIVN